MDTKDVAQVLNDLIENSRDGALGFGECAKHVQSTELRTLFTERAAACERAAQELENCLARYGERADAGGTAAGAVHRGWVALRGSLSGKSDLAMLEECERGEDAAVARYRNALQKTLPPDVREILQRHYEGALRNHDQVKALRERYRAQEAGDTGDTLGDADGAIPPRGPAGTTHRPRA